MPSLMVLIIKHINIEGPGTLGEFLAKNQVKTDIVNIDKGEKLPKNFNNISAIIILGGPMNVYEVEKYPFLKTEEEFIKRAIEKNIPVLGICLGAQLLAKSLGAEVKKSPEKEIGWSKVRLTKDAFQDRLFKGLEKKLDVFQWHEDMFELPKKSVLLAESAACPSQAFRFGKNCYGLQFHLEIDKSIIDSWTAKYGMLINLPAYLCEYFKKRPVLEKQTEILYRNFLKLISKN